MRFLLDTQTLINYLRSDTALPSSIQEFMEDYDNQCFVSVISLHEIVIKSAKNKLKFNYNLGTVLQYLKQESINIVPILPKHVLQVESFEQNPLHKDPFDRLLIAQCIEEKLTFLTTDHKIPMYAQYGLDYLQYNN